MDWTLDCTLELVKPFQHELWDLRMNAVEFDPVIKLVIMTIATHKRMRFEVVFLVVILLFSTYMKATGIRDGSSHRKQPSGDWLFSRRQPTRYG